jgi:hypothetical protein
MNDSEGVAQSYGQPSKNDAVDFIRRLKHHGADIPIIGGGVLEL